MGYDTGLKFVYAGNIPGALGKYENTFCPDCKGLLIERIGFRVGKNRIRDGKCPDCGGSIPGRWDATPTLQRRWAQPLRVL
jgi:pyruvate formate lyase activating enzyme